MAQYVLRPLDIGKKLQQKLLIIIPVYNEENAVRDVVQEWRKTIKPHEESFAFVLIDDGSNDDTWSILEELEAKTPGQIVLLHKPNSGHGNSCRVGYDVAAASQCEWVFQIDSDGQCDPQYFEKVWEKRHEADFVVGVRKSRDDGLARRFISFCCWFSCFLVTGKNLHDPNVPYRLMTRSAVTDAIASVPSGFYLQNVAVMFALHKLKHLRGDVVPIHFRDRQGGSPSANVLKLIESGVVMLLELARIRIKQKE